MAVPTVAEVQTDAWWDSKSSVDFTLSSAPSSGDTLLLFIQTFYNAVSDAGWDTILDIEPVGSWVQRFAILSHECDGTEGTSISITLDGVNSGGAAVLVVLEGAEHPVSFDVDFINEGEDVEANVTFPAVTPPAADSIVFHFVGNERAGSYTAGPAGDTFVAAVNSGETISGNIGVFSTSSAASATGVVYTPTWHYDHCTASLAIAPASDPPSGDTRRLIIS